SIGKAFKILGYPDYD
nr:Chain C, SIGK Peptide [synthetic construct]